MFKRKQEEPAQIIPQDTQGEQMIPQIKQQLPAEILDLELRSFNDTLLAIERKLLGLELVMDDEGREAWEETGKKWLNKNGVQVLMGILRSYVDTNTILSQLMDTDINMICWSLADEMATVLSNKCVEFELEMTYLGVVFGIIIDSIYMCLKRSQGALTLRQIHQSTERREGVTSSSERKGLFGRFF